MTITLQNASTQAPLTNCKPFLSAQWRYLAVANFPVDPAVLEPYVPSGTSLDYYQGETFLSVVGFLFLDTRLLGCGIPFHRDFEEVNLRFYVRREEKGEIRRGVVFIKELVPRWAVTAVARAVYNENYLTVPMRHRLVGFEDPGASQRFAGYEWRFGGRWHALHMQATGAATPLQPDTHEEFILEHYWGYCRQRDGGTVEYCVEHPRWNVWTDTTVHFDCDVERLYGREFLPALSRSPGSAFIADGSAVRVHQPCRCPTSL